jgi:hypothetical protein
MQKQKTNFKPVKIRNIGHLKSIVKDNIESKNSAYYLIVNQWDKVCNYFNSKLDWDGPYEEDSVDLNVIDLFDIRSDIQNSNPGNYPNYRDPLAAIRMVIKSHRETVSTLCLQSYDQLPLLVVVHKSFPRLVSYNGAIGAELGI